MKNREQKNEALTGGFELNVRLGTWPGGFDGFLAECESLQRDLTRNPYNAKADFERVKLLIEIAKKWHSGYGAQCNPATMKPESRPAK